jgi:hypothetical protein
VSNLKDSLKKKVKGPSAIDVLTSPITGKADQPENEAENESLQGLQGTPGTLDNTVLPSKHDKHELQDKQSKHELPDNNSLQSNHSNTDLLSIQELPNKQSLQSKPSKHSKPSKQGLQDKRSKQSNTGKATSSNGLSDGWVRATFIMREDNLEKVKDFAYWERLQIKEVIDEALEIYFSEKKIRKRPEKRGG